MVLFKVIWSPLLLNDFITSVTSFCYLGSLLESHGGVQMELNTRISRAASVFGVLRMSVFSDHMLSLTTKSMVYQTVMLHGCSAICCGNLACEAEGGKNFRDFSPSLFKNIVRYITIFADFPAY